MELLNKIINAKNAESTNVNLVTMLAIIVHHVKTITLTSMASAFHSLLDIVQLLIVITAQL